MRSLVVVWTVCAASIQSTEATAAAHSSYWATDSTFLPVQKQNESCIDPSIKRLCSTMATSANDTHALADAALDIDTSAILSSSDPSVAEDAHHWLAIAACRVCVNQNPNAEESGHGNDVPPLRIPVSISKPLLAISVALKREPSIGYAGLVLDNCVRHTPHEYVSPSPPASVK